MTTKKSSARMRGRVISWTMPHRDNGGLWRSVVVLEDDSEERRVEVVTRTAEEHIWITRAGVWVQVNDTSASLMGDVVDPAPRYVDLPEVKQISGLRFDEERLVVHFAGGTIRVWCTDPEKQGQLLALGVGATVQLYSVKLRADGQLVLHAGSAIVFQEPPRAPPSPPPRPPPLSLKKYRGCLNCSLLNCPTRSSCRRCNVTRRDGPLPDDWIPRVSKDHRYCHRCHRQRNDYYREYWKCGVKKKKRYKEVYEKKKR